MNSTHRFNRDEISKILKHAAELEHKDHADNDGEGLTLQELEQVSADVGINPKYIQKAFDKLKTGGQSEHANFIGGPFTYNFSTSAEGILKEEDWEDVVSEIRRIHGGIGKTNKMGNTFEWEQRKKEVGYIQISLTPKKDHTRMSINASYNYYATVIYVITGVLSFMLISVLLPVLAKKLGFPLVPLAITGAAGILGMVGGARFYLSRWMKKKRKTYHKLFERFHAMLAPIDGEEHEPAISISDNNVNATEVKTTSSQRSKTK